MAIPTTWAPALASILRVRSNAARGVLPLAATSKTPSTRVDKIVASVTASIGGESRMTQANCFLISLSRPSISSEANNSAGLDGTGPEVRQERLGRKERSEEQ